MLCDYVIDNIACNSEQRVLWFQDVIYRRICLHGRHINSFIVVVNAKRCSTLPLLAFCNKENNRAIKQIIVTAGFTLMSEIT